MTNPKTTTIEISDPPYMVGETSIAKIVIGEVGFEAFLAAIARVKGGEDYAKLAYRERAKIQTKFFDQAGGLIAVTDEALLQMPLQYGKAFTKALDSEGSSPGKIIQEGDGITTPIIYELGTPIPVKGNGEIRELEFMAKTLGDIEDVVHRSSSFEQALALIQSVARPLGADAQMLALPSWAVAAISVPDGVTIANAVLPSFLD